MAALTPVLIDKDGDNIRAAFYRVRNVTTNDTVSVASEFNRVHAAAAIDATRSLAYDAPAVSGTTITLDQASLSGDTVYLLVLGAAAS